MCHGENIPTHLILWGGIAITAIGLAISMPIALATDLVPDEGENAMVALSPVMFMAAVVLYLCLRGAWYAPTTPKNQINNGSNASDLLLSDPPKTYGTNQNNRDSQMNILNKNENNALNA